MEEKTTNEIFPGMSVEEIKALFFDRSALREPAYKVFQLNSEGYRYYYRFNNGEPEFYPSVTTLLGKVMPTSPFLIKWMVENGAEGAAEKRDLAAAYGTFMHIQFEQLIINRKYDFDAVPNIVQEFIQRENLPDKVFNEWAIKIRKDVLAFAQFVRDWNVRPLAIEIGLVHPDYHYAGCIDLPCVLTDTKTGEDFAAIVDFKSGRKGFWEELEIQLHLYKMMWNVNFPDLPVERVFNFSPKDWRTKPTYNFKEQTDSPNAAKIPHLLALATIEDEKRDNTVTVVCGQLDLDGDFSNNVLELSLAELIKTRASEPTPEIPENENIFGDSDKTPQKGAVTHATERKGNKSINTPTEGDNALKTEMLKKILNGIFEEN